MDSWNLAFQSVAYRSLDGLHRFVPSHWAFSFLILIISSFVMKYLYSKVYQQKATQKYPTFPWISSLRAIIAGRKRSRVSFLELIFGLCYVFRKEGIYGTEFGPLKFVALFDLEAVKFILSSRTILSKGAEYDIFKKVFKDGLFTSNGRKWQARRRQLMPCFHFRILGDFFDTYNKQANILVKRIDELMKKETSVEVISAVGLCTLDIVLETVIGVSVEEVEAQRKEFFIFLHRAAEIVSKRFTLPWLWTDFFFYWTEEGKKMANYVDLKDKFLTEVIEKRKRHMTENLHLNKNHGSSQLSCDTSSKSKERLPMLDLLLNFHLKDNSVTYEEIREEVLIFLAAGHDTTALAVSWTLYLLGLHQDIQTNVHREVDAVLGDDINRTITVEDLRCLTYLHCVLKESMRLYPPGGFAARTLREDTVINGYELKKGTSVAIPIFVVHRNPKVFPNPEKFIPDRFNDENSKNIPPFAYIPFSAGPRNCIGQKFATYAAMTILSTVLRHFTVEALEHRDKIGLAFNVLMEPENKIHLEFTRRQFFKHYSQ